MNVTINGRPHEVEGLALSHEDICALAGQPDFASVTYSGPRHGDSQRSGITHRGRSVDVEEGMRFTCVVTGSA